MIIAQDVTSVRPILSASSPPAIQPNAPAPMTMNEAASANAGWLSYAAKLARIITGVQDQKEDDQSARDGQCGNEEDVGPPVAATERINQVRRRLAERERADENAEREPTPASKPRRHDLHPRRIDSGQEETREEAQRDARHR